jgi:transcriptional regulator with XRE-family HTH domain
LLEEISNKKFDTGGMTKMPNRIKELRDGLDWSQETLARAANTSNQQIGYLEKGQRRLTTEWMKRLADAMGCQPEDLLLTGRGTPNPAKAVPSVIGARGPKGELILTVPPGSPIYSIAHKLLRLAASASADERNAVIMRLENPVLYQGTSQPRTSQADYVTGVRSGLQGGGIDPDSPQGARLIAEAVENRATGIHSLKQLAQAAPGRKGNNTPGLSEPKSRGISGAHQKPKRQR